MLTVRPVRRLAGLGAAAALALAAAGPAHAAAPPFRQLNLVSDIPGVARITDPNLVNPWGLSAGPTTPLWVADNGTGVSTLYSGGVDGSLPATLPLVVSIPGGAPTGTVFNPTSGFPITLGGVTGPARFLFDSEAGKITAWAPTSPLVTHAVTVGGRPGAIYKGLALASTGAGPRLYAADFHHNRIDVLNSRFKPVHDPGGFTDPDLPAGYAPFNVQALDGRLYVAYAMQDADAEDEVAGPGLGIVDVYNTSGRLLRRLVSDGGALDAPWGLAIAPPGWGAFGRDLLVGNFGDGTIHAYDRRTGALDGELTNEDGNPIRIDGLWGLRFGNGTFGAPRALVFSAGLADESHGLLGEIVEP